MRARTPKKKRKASRRASGTASINWFDLVPIGLLVLNEFGLIRAINQNAARLLTVLPEWALALPFANFLVDRRLFRRLFALWKAQGGSQISPSPIVLKQHAAPPITVEISGEWRAATGEAHLVMVDVSDRLRVKAAEEAAQSASQTRDTFIAMLSHELRAPLTPVLAAASALRGGHLVARKVRQLCATIERNVQLQAHLIDNLLDLTRLLRGKVPIDSVSVALHGLVAEVVGMLRGEIRGKGLSLAVDTRATNDWVAGDPLRLRQIFWNLLGNAIKFTPRGGRITVQSWNSSNNQIALEVQDTGVGLSAQMLQRIFEPFEQAATGKIGLGLGLAIARGLAHMHRGEIAATSNGPGLGARFVVTLPTLKEAAVRETPPVPVPLPLRRQPRGAGRILLVDDHTASVAALSSLLRSAGFSVVTASSVREALRVELKNIALVISDVGLPDGDGRSLLRQLQRRKPVKAIALSGFGTDEDVQTSLDAGFSRHLVKPITLEALLAAVRGALGEK